MGGDFGVAPVRVARAYKTKEYDQEVNIVVALVVNLFESTISFSTLSLSLSLSLSPSNVSFSSPLVEVILVPLRFGLHKVFREARACRADHQVHL